MKNIEQFKNQQYINLETFRKNGTGVKTPVWFAQDGNTLRVWTFAGAGKAKRIRRDAKVRIVPSNASGEPTGEWIDAHATVLDDQAELAHTANLFKKKYGITFGFFSLLGKMRRTNNTTIRVELN